MTPADAGPREALIAAVRKAADQPMMSERKALAIAVGVLGAVREPGDFVLAEACHASNEDMAASFRAAIDALIAEVATTT